MLKDQFLLKNRISARIYQEKLSINKQQRSFGMVSQSFTENQNFQDQPVQQQIDQGFKIKMEQQIKRQKKGKECMRIKCQVESQISEEDNQIMDEQLNQSSPQNNSVLYSSISQSNSKYNLRQRQKKIFNQFKPKQKIKIQKQDPVKHKSTKTRTRVVNIVPAHFIQLYQPKQQAKAYHSGQNSKLNSKTLSWTQIQSMNLQQIANKLTQHQKNFCYYNVKQLEGHETITHILWANYQDLPSQAYYVRFQSEKQAWLLAEEVLRINPRILAQFKQKQLQNLSDKISQQSLARFK